MNMRLKMKNRSHTYDINRPRSRHRHKYTKYKMCLSIMIGMKNLSNTEAELKRSVAYKKRVYRVEYILQYHGYLSLTDLKACAQGDITKDFLKNHLNIPIHKGKTVNKINSSKNS